MTNANTMITEQIQRIEKALADPDTTSPDALPEVSDTGLQCSIDVTLFEEEDRSVVAHAEVVPGGAVDEVILKARDGEDVARADVDVESDPSVCRALAIWFERMWTSWDEVLCDSGVEPYEVSAGDLTPGDRVWRLDLTVAAVEEAGIDTAGRPMVAVTFEDSPGREVWRAERRLTAFRPARDSGDDDD